MRVCGVVTYAMTAASLAAPTAAAPWVRDENGWYARTLVSAETLDGADGWRSDTYTEYGLSNRLTFTAKAEAIMFPDAASFDRQAFRLTLRRQIISARGWTLGAEAGPIYGSTATGTAACSGPGGELRTGLGFSGYRKGQPFHAFADAALLQQEGDCRRARIELGYGADIGHGVFTGQQIWLEDGNQSADSLKTESQLGYHFKRFDLALGYREELGGVFQEQAVLVAITARR